MAYGTINAEQLTTQSGFTLGAGNASSFKNRIINGAMVIDQRNAGASVAIDGNNIYTLDRFGAQDATDGAFTVQQDSTAPTGFTKSLKVTVTTADASLGATQVAQLYQYVEGFNVADLGWGTATAQTITISFWVRSSLTGTFGGCVSNDANNRSYPFTYTISVANTFEYKSITIAGDTSGTWLTTNGVGLRLYIGLGAGATYSGTAGAWAGALYLTATGATSVVGTNGATFYITGVQLEVGTVATSFDYRSYGTELALCQRYCPVITVPLNAVFGNGFMYSSTGSISNVKLPVTTRVPPTGVTVSSASHFELYWSGSDITCTTISFSYGTTDYAALNFEVASGATTNAGNMIRSANASAQLTLTGCEL